MVTTFQEPVEALGRYVSNTGKGRIDLVKIDTEGSEADLVAAVPSDLDIGAIVYEDNEGFTKWLRCPS
jgi:hypothetical protein